MGENAGNSLGDPGNICPVKINYLGRIEKNTLEAPVNLALQETRIGAVCKFV